MICHRPGTLLPVRSIGAMAAAAHEADRLRRNESLAKRRSVGAPAYEAEGAPLASEVDDEPPYVVDPDLEGLRGQVRVLAQRDLQRWQLAIADGVRSYALAEDSEARAESFAKQVETMRAFVRASWGQISGFVVDGEAVALGGPDPADWTESDLDLLESNQLLTLLGGLSSSANQLKGERRGNFGASQL